MSTPFYDLASLVVVPSGYKASKVYAQKPLTTDGQLAFSRSTGATRVNSAGLIEKVRTNLALYSNDFSNAAWLKSGSTVTAGYSDPNGGNNAFKVDISAGGNHYLYQGITMPTGYKTVSCWIKADSSISIGFNVGGSTPNAINLTTTWTRFSFVTTDTSGGVFFGNYFGPTPAQEAKTFYVYQSQLELSDFGPTAYIPTTTAAVSVGPVANVPRLDYLGSSCPRLLLEPQRTNTLLLSEQLDVIATWARGGVSVTANNAVSPDGYTNADLITADGTTTQHYVLQGQVGAARTYSIFLKMGTQRYVQILTSGTAAPVANYDLQNGVANMVGSNSTASIQSYGNGWYRCILSTTDAAAASFYLLFASSMTSGRFESNNSSGTIWAYGAQAEVGTYATSYIPTLGSASTRGSDVCSKTGISSLIGQTEGTLFIEFFYNEKNNTSSGSDKSVMRVESGGGYSNEIAIVYYGDEGGSYGKTIQGFITVGGASQAILKTTQTMVSGYYKVAVAYKANDFAMAVNGVIVATDNSGSVPTCANFSLNESTRIQSDINPKQAMLFKTRLTNAQLAELTTL